MVRARRATLGTLLLCASLAGCAGQLRTGEQMPSYELSISDDPSSREFRLQLMSKSMRAFCIDAEGWPNSVGRVWAGSEPPLIRLRWRGGVLDATERVDEYCPGGCQVEISALATIAGQVKYEEFGDPDYVASLPD